MSWFANRKCTKAEDEAYSLLGIFGVSIPLPYTEDGEGAFRKLQEEIMKYSDDYTLFAWELPSKPSDRWFETGPTPEGVIAEPEHYGLLAPSPQCFRGSVDFIHKARPEDAMMSQPYSFTNKGVAISLKMLLLHDYENVFLALLECPTNKLSGEFYLAVYLKYLGGQRYCCTPSSFGKVSSKPQGQWRSILVIQEESHQGISWRWMALDYIRLIPFCVYTNNMGYEHVTALLVSSNHSST